MWSRLGDFAGPMGFLLVLWGQGYEIYGSVRPWWVHCWPVRLLQCYWRPSLVMLMLFLILRGYCWSCEVIVVKDDFQYGLQDQIMSPPLTGGRHIVFWFCHRRLRCLLRRHLCDSL